MDVSASTAAGAATSPQADISSPPPLSVEPLVRVAIDGSKLIIRLLKEAKIIVEHPNKVIVRTEHVKYSSSVSSNIILSTQSDKPQLVIIDSLISRRYFPIHLDMYGVVYTTESCSHVIVGDIKRCKVTNRAFPYKYCNKFVAPLANELVEEAAPGNGVNSPSLSNYDSQLNKEATELLVKNYRKNLQINEVRNTVFIRGDESLTRLVLSSGEKLFLENGKIIAWTVGISFTYRRICCYRRVVSVQAEKCGVVWIFNSYRYPQETSKFIK